MLLYALVNDLGELLLTHLEANLRDQLIAGDAAVHKAQILRDGIIEDIDTDGGMDAAGKCLAVQCLGGTHQNRLVQIQHPGLIGHQRLIGAAVDLQLMGIFLIDLLPVRNGGKHAGIADLIGGVHLIDDGG